MKTPVFLPLCNKQTLLEQEKIAICLASAEFELVLHFTILTHNKYFITWNHTPQEIQFLKTQITCYIFDKLDSTKIY